MLAKACAGKKASLKAALLDQRVVAGLGNIYVCEALFRAHLSPKRRATTPPKRQANARAEALVEAIRAVLNDAIRRAARHCAITAARMERSATSSTIFAVYDREGKPCPTLQGDGEAHCAAGTLHVLLSEVPEVARA